MHPIICQIGPLTIYSYGLMLAVGILLAVNFAGAQAQKQGIDKAVVVNAVFIAAFSGVAGARVFYVIENLHYYSKNPLEIFMLQYGGLSWFGGLAAALLCLTAYLKKRKVSAIRVFDLLAPFTALAQSIGRIGCLLNGCCHGKESLRWGIYFKTHNAFLIPTQIYSSLFLLALFVILRMMQERRPAAGSVFLAYLLIYSLCRFFIEFLRADNSRVLFGMTLFQFISIAAFFASLFLLFRIFCGKKRGR